MCSWGVRIRRTGNVKGPSASGVDPMAAVRVRLQGLTVLACLSFLVLTRVGTSGAAEDAADSGAATAEAAADGAAAGEAKAADPAADAAEAKPAGDAAAPVLPPYFTSVSPDPAKPLWPDPSARCGCAGHAGRRCRRGTFPRHSA